MAYDPKETTFTKLLEAFAAQTDVTQMNRQGSDRGTQYRCGVYYHTEQQKADIEAYWAQLNEEIAAGKRNWSGKTVVAEVKPAGARPGPPAAYTSSSFCCRHLRGWGALVLWLWLCAAAS